MTNPFQAFPRPPLRNDRLLPDIYKHVRIFSACTLAALIVCVFSVSGLANESYRGVAVQIEDGATLTIWEHRRMHRIRLYGITVPGMDRPLGQAAKSFSSTKVFNTELTVILQKCHPSEPPCGVIEVKGTTLNAQLVAQGLAKVNSGCREPVCEKWKALEQKARQQKLGLWACEETRPSRPDQPR